MASRPHCIVCGKKIHLRHINLPHGTLHVCNSSKCFKKIMFAEGETLPIVWGGVDDMGEHEILTAEELKGITAEEWIVVSEAMSEFMWDDFFGGKFHETLEHGAKILEQLRIKNTPKKNLPLLLGHIKDTENQKYLEERIKENE